MGILYLVSTPIGNMEDVSGRMKRVLEEVEVVACEDTRKTGNLLKQLGLPKKKLLSYYEENETRRIPEIISFLKSGLDVALVSSAGTPTLSDPGYKLVRECIAQGIQVSPIPGPSAILSALVASGLPTDKFLFLGFLPKKPGKRKRVLESLPKKTTAIFFESPHRLLKTLEAIKEIYGDIEIAIARELTKLHEEIRREKTSHSIVYFSKRKPKGEFTLVVRIV